MLESKRLSEQKLIEALRSGDEDAFTAIYKEYWYRMFLVANRKLQNREVAEEMIQDIFTKLWKDREKTRIIHLDYYLFSAVRYEVIDHIRACGPQNEYLAYYQAFSNFEDFSTENTIAFNDLVETIDKGLDILPEKSKEIFKLNRIEQWSVSKIAHHFDLSEKAVEYHLTKATKSVRTYLKETLVSVYLIIAAFLS
ncbi:RNA polymerase sigma factor [Dyadobacter sp. NIV53]|uniref:RNA polymerase sigma factor n=1 Tax=Dyadobacter sp. NIV53 TaxID=2861765 RepID=UPI001C849065|nr:sigma-70 family RNA polymerase sigma factor [Dyadobacter sp. NIV53]